MLPPTADRHDAAVVRIVFAGTPEFAVPRARALLGAGHTLVAVLHPAGPARRSRAQAARRARSSSARWRTACRSYQPATLRDQAEAAGRLRALAPDLHGGGRLRPDPAAGGARPCRASGCINIHASLLPRWRGAAPIQRAILAGDAETGVTHHADGSRPRHRAGAAPRVAYADRRATTPAAQLHDRLAELGAGSVVRTRSRALARGALAAAAQDDARRHLRRTSSARTRRASTGAGRRAELERQVRAFNPWPVAADHARRPDSCASGRRMRAQPGRTAHRRPSRARCWPLTARRASYVALRRTACLRI
ncbi:MAG: methionyl-tRNA formyltransferase [Chromatiales bacterium]|nr:methionyl-tRNA formyltransferase [Chromatiales bacterium]